MPPLDYQPIFLYESWYKNGLFFVTKLKAADFINNIFQSTNKELLAIYPSCYISVEGCTLLHYAVTLERLDLVQLLLSKGADVNLRASYQMLPSGEIIDLTPFELAQDLKLMEISQILEQHIAKKSDNKFRGSARFFSGEPIGVTSSVDSFRIS